MIGWFFRANRITWLAAMLLLAALTPARRPCWAAERKTKHLLLITLDGLRWQELFSGAEESLLNREDGGVRDVNALRRRFWSDDPTERRARLMPFFWSQVATGGQVIGDPQRDSSVRCTNGRYFSYPGYSELLCGFVDPSIDSNDKRPNPNTNVLEWLHARNGYRGRIAAFASWDVFPFILNHQRSGLYVNAGWQQIVHPGPRDTALDELSSLANELPKVWPNVRYDVFTFRAALSYLRRHRPRVFYVALGETDDWAHEGRYDLYLDAAWRNDRYLAALWQAVQAMPAYKDATSLMITTDHGRGDGREGWKNHSVDLPGSERMWIAVLGPDTPARGLRQHVHAQQAQVAATVAALLGEDFVGSDPRIAPPLPGVLAAAE